MSFYYNMYNMNKNTLNYGPALIFVDWNENLNLLRSAILRFKMAKKNRHILTSNQMIQELFNCTAEIYSIHIYSNDLPLSIVTSKNSIYVFCFDLWHVFVMYVGRRSVLGCNACSFSELCVKRRYQANEKVKFLLKQESIYVGKISLLFILPGGVLRWFNPQMFSFSLQTDCRYYYGRKYVTLLAYLFMYCYKFQVMAILCKDPLKYI